jgi:hypothetical protein
VRHRSFPTHHLKSAVALTPCFVICADHCRDKLAHLDRFSDLCGLTCSNYDFRHFSFLFTAFVFMQVRPLNLSWGVFIICACR